MTKSLKMKNRLKSNFTRTGSRDYLLQVDLQDL